MTALNDAFFFITDKIAALQKFFWNEAWSIGRIVLFIALVSAAINYALTGEGLKGNIIKIGKALVFFIVIMWAYPWIISHLTEWAFTKARDAVFTGGLQRELEQNQEETALTVEAALEDDAAFIASGGFTRTITTSVSDDNDPRSYFSDILVRHTSEGGNSYWAIAPQAALGSVLLIAGECFTFADNAPKHGAMNIPDFGQIIKGYLCGLAVMLTGGLAVLEYIVTFMEYMFVTSVGILLFPLSLWEGTKFMAEKLISAIIGFFIKMLFCTICLFLMLYIFSTASRYMAESKFMGTVDQMFMVFFVSLLAYFMCTKIPGMAQSLLTGAPSLSASSAIGAAGSALATMGMAGGLAKAGGAALAGGAAKGAFAGAGMITQAGAAGQAAKEAGGNGSQIMAARMASMGHSAGEALKAGGGDLTRSLLGNGGRSGGSGSGGGLGSGGVNRHSQRQMFGQAHEADGTKKTFGEYIASRQTQGASIGKNYMDKQNKKEKSDNA
jgi:hypothetical protein